MKTSIKPFTYDDYLALPDDGKRHEIIDGELTMTPAPVPRHQKIQVKLTSVLHTYVEGHSLGEVYCAPIDLVLSMVDIVQPDLLFVAKHRMRIIAEKNIIGIPNLIVEIVSPSSIRRDREEKLNLYQRYALPEYWIVDPETETIEVYLYAESRLEKVEILKSGDQFRSRQVPGLIVEAAEVFK